MPCRHFYITAATDDKLIGGDFETLVLRRMRRGVVDESHKLS